MPVRNDFAPGEFCWIDLTSHDLEAMLAWYGELFGWSHQIMPTPGDAPPYAFFMQGDAVIGGIGQMNEEMKAQGIPPMWNSYIATANCEATEAKVHELGGTVTAPTTEIPGYGKLAFFLDPEGASFAAWQSTTPEPQGVHVNEPNGWCWNELVTRDVDKSRAFYGELTGWDYATLPMGEFDYTLLKVAGKDAGGMMPMVGPQWEGIPPHWMVYFAVADCDAIGARAESARGKIVVPATEIQVGRFSVLRDPQGTPFSVIALNQPPS